MLGIYEKALPKDISWAERLTLAKELGFDFVEMSVDETDERIARLDWTKAERKLVRDAIFDLDMPILSMCLSAHRRYPLGSADLSKQEMALELLTKAVDLASDLGIRSIQLAGYDVYYDPKTVATRHAFIENLRKCVAIAANKSVVLSIEIMDDPFINSISKFLAIKAQIPSPYLQVYPDLGNLSAWPENAVGYELENGISAISQIHLKDTLAVTADFEGKFKNVDFGAGCVDFVGCLKTLKRLHYSGSFVIEMWSETSDTPTAEIEKAKAIVLPFLKEAGYA
ncbi:L-xylulose 5-phosphate 3-epimerase [Lactococcus hodotermopsidis]|uniref:L-ribulose-5-phosphate 3-epimerase n=1 Tax=Pseudolactococcus hodotermopsidis TaxID=2709157 RepID=A0A6A0BDA7_9LACT|nr:L-ribulose-5-phosphate 3-epimerase [Lactococcus hodotermopsidis]GFH42444.1 L-xylulose 5-phosphate 3-epimerase [Lactococcus hodotermopsidis]